MSAVASSTKVVAAVPAAGARDANPAAARRVAITPRALVDKVRARGDDLIFFMCFPVNFGRALVAPSCTLSVSRLLSLLSPPSPHILYSCTVQYCKGELDWIRRSST